MSEGFSITTKIDKGEQLNRIYWLQQSWLKSDVVFHTGAQEGNIV
jgi:hypothetical protein